ncbi:MAG: hypothetical protein Q9166_007088 [cf. Caloplaca sp. 2 TL-2023]
MTVEIKQEPRSRSPSIDIPSQKTYEPLRFSALHFILPTYPDSDVLGDDAKPVYNFDPTSPYRIYCQINAHEKHEDSALRLELKLTAHTSHFKFSGRFYVNYFRFDDDPPAPEENGSDFRIKGTGTVKLRRTGNEFFNLTFRVVKGSGTKIFTGVSGNGKIRLLMPIHRLGDWGCLKGSRGVGQFNFETVSYSGVSPPQAVGL